MSARIFPWLEEAKTPEEMADAPARPRHEKPKDAAKTQRDSTKTKRDSAKTKRDAAKTQRRKWDKARIV